MPLNDSITSINIAGSPRTIPQVTYSVEKYSWVKILKFSFYFGSEDNFLLAGNDFTVFVPWNSTNNKYRYMSNTVVDKPVPIGFDKAILNVINGWCLYDGSQSINKISNCAYFNSLHKNSNVMSGDSSEYFFTINANF